MRAVWGVLLVFAALAAQAQDRTLSVSSRESPDQRLALVIGNSAYKVGPLRNPANDARAMAAALKTSGFEVMHGENLSHRQMFEMTRDFGRKLKPGAVKMTFNSFARVGNVASGAQHRDLYELVSASQR